MLSFLHSPLQGVGGEFYILPLIFGFLLDCLIGDPHSWPHPVRWFGWLISNLELRFNSGKHRKQKGSLVAGGLVAVVWAIAYFLQFSLNSFLIPQILINSILVYWCIANRGLIQESYAVIKALKKDGLEAGRKQLSYIVGRDTSKLNEQQIRTAVLETMAENLSDGVVTPLFFYALGGVPAMVAFKMASTLDSTIAYKSLRYKEFGWFAARLDDVLNLIPARLTALLMVILSFSWRGFVYIFRYGHKHASPNAGYPEAALAGILNTRFGGPNVYHGQLVEKPYIGTTIKELTNRDFYFTAVLNTLVSVACVLLVAFIN